MNAAKDYVSGNALIDKQLADKISVNPGEAVSAMNIIAGARSNVMFYDAAKRKLDEALAEIVQNRDRISWLEQSYEQTLAKPYDKARVEFAIKALAEKEETK